MKPPHRILADTIRRWRLIYRVNFKGSSPYGQLRLAFRIINRMLFKPDSPLWVMLGMTYHCQCRCVHCGMGEYHRDPSRELTTMEIFRIVDQVVDIGAVKIVFFGGEPLCREDTVSAVAYAASKGLVTSLDTNGLLLDLAKAKALKRAGLKSIQVSLDSADPARHDRLRGREGLFEQVLKAIENCKEAGLFCIVSTYASKEGLRSGGLSKLVRLSRELKVDAIRIVQPIAAGRWLDASQVLLDEEEEALLASLVDKSFVYTDDQKGGYRDCGSIRKEFFYISPLGDFQPCCYIPLSFGDVRAETIKVLWSRMRCHPLYHMERNVCPMNNPDFRTRFVDAIPRGEKWPVQAALDGHGIAVRKS